ncbi:MAG: hypothetical protein LBE22_01000 [Azoarcus sp.]|nr:hypothetical protein [Azoarcus sp.]
MQTTQKPVLKNAQDFIEFFRQGGEYYDRQYLPNLMAGTQPDPQALKVLGEALLTDNQNVRRNIIRLLEDIARLNHRAYELRTPEVIDLMVGPGFAKLDSARGDAMQLLRNYASTSTLSHYEDVFLQALKDGSEVIDLLLIAKAKPKGAWEEVDRLSRLPKWKSPSGSNWESMRIARAALGDTKIEDEYIADAEQKEEAGDVDGLLSSFDQLTRIGTQRSLQAVCKYMRSPIIIDTSLEKRSIRLYVMQSLIYAFPEEWRMLDPSSVRKDEDYIRVEQFCEKATGVRYDKPRPPFFVSFAYRGDPPPVPPPPPLPSVP